MRPGAYTATLVPGSRVSEIYGGATSISERHRHRYEANIHYKQRPGQPRIAVGRRRLRVGHEPRRLLTLSASSSS